MKIKKILSLILAVILLFSVAACSGNKDDVSENGESTTEYVPTPPVVKNDSRHHEYKAADGTVSYVLDVSIPKITENVTADVVALLDYYFEDIYNEAVRAATNNVENARDFMLKMTDSKTPWARTIDCETVYCTEDFISIKFTDHFSMMGGQNVPKVYAKLFNVKTGAMLTLSDLAIEGDEETMLDLLLTAIIDKADKEFYANGEPLSDEQKQLIRDNFKTIDFCYDGENITFFVNKTLLDQSYSGTYKCEFAFSEVNYILITPEETLA